MTRLSVSYDAWGNASDSGAAVAERFRYRGAFQDGDPGLLLFGRRWYDPALGRWLTQDPILADVLAARRDAGTAALDIANVYLYVASNPLNFADTSGLGPLMDWFKKTLLGKILEAWLRGKRIDWPSGQPQLPEPEKVAKKSPNANEDESGDTPDEFEPGAGEGSRSPSSERGYRRLAEQEAARSGGGYRWSYWRCTDPGLGGREVDCGGTRGARDRGSEFGWCCRASVISNVVLSRNPTEVRTNKMWGVWGTWPCQSP